ncbi:MAG TPA: DUF4386 domain-containing protein [Actinomycetota bacterium]|nr:DUF4386 domain-containing protein [Actinomycetota bacterium]
MALETKRIARTFGVWFLLTWVFAIAARMLFEPAYTDPDFVLGAGSDFRVQLGAVFEFLLLIANIATAVVLYPVVKRQSQIGAMGYVTARLMESAFLMVGLLSLVSLVALRQDMAGATGADAAALEATGSALVSIYKFGFLFGPGLVVGFGNGLLLGWLMYSSGLVPRRLAVWGFIGGCSIIVAFVLVLFGVIETGSPAQALFSLPEMVWEAGLPIYCLWKGFKPSPITETIDIREPAVAPSMATV